MKHFLSIQQMFLEHLLVLGQATCSMQRPRPTKMNQKQGQLSRGFTVQAESRLHRKLPSPGMLAGEGRLYDIKTANVNQGLLSSFLPRLRVPHPKS